MIAVEGITKRYGPILAVDDVSFQVGQGEVVGFLGPNGAGKTTAMRMLVGTLQPDKGGVRLDGRPIGENLSEAKRRIGYMPESNALYKEMLVSEYLDYAADLKGIAGPERKAAVGMAVNSTGIADVYYRTINQLSKGYRQRVGLAGAILHRPEVLILDEPTQGLDPNQRVGIRELIRELGRDRTVILSSHVLGEVEATCDRLLIINRGRLVADGPVSSLLEQGRAGARYTVEAEGSHIVDSLARLPGVDWHQATEEDGRVRIVLGVTGTEELRPAIFKLATERGWTLLELHRERTSLEELFRDLTDPSDASGAPEDGATDRSTGGEPAEPSKEPTADTVSSEAAEREVRQ